MPVAKAADCSSEAPILIGPFGMLAFGDGAVAHPFVPG